MPSDTWTSSTGQASLLCLAEARTGFVCIILSQTEWAAAGRTHPRPRRPLGRHHGRLDSPDLPQHVYLHPLVATIVDVANLDLVGVLVGGHHLGSPPGPVHARSSADDCYCGQTRACAQSRRGAGRPQAIPGPARTKGKACQPCISAARNAPETRKCPPTPLSLRRSLRPR